eukprot:TRINITY_DN1594_c0_g1_i1.p1 TRINITY_DN1594_c0_g1~~TRINITY_DN1594_c0_g1_i1.p1  ORF type:complete len:772 (+),score=173.82 TRINITY_DN1594_c0_g1_i1:76-2391(+)
MSSHDELHARPVKLKDSNSDDINVVMRDLPPDRAYPSPSLPVHATESEQANRYVQFFAAQLIGWWTFSALYNVEVKKFFLTAPLPVEATLVQLFISITLSVSLTKKLDLVNANIFTIQGLSSFLVLAVLHLFGTLATNYSVSLMSVSFAHVVKAAEPIFTILWSIGLASFGISAAPININLQRFIAISVIIGGVLLASVSETTFSWQGLFWGLLANLSFSGRNLLSKTKMSLSGVPQTTLFLVLNFLSSLMLGAWVILTGMAGGSPLLALPPSSVLPLFTSSIYYFIFTAISMNILEGVEPITHALSNTCKRLVIVFVSCSAFHCQLSASSKLGALMTIFGVGAYSVAKASPVKDTTKMPTKTSPTPSTKSIVSAVIILVLLLPFPAILLTAYRGSPSPSVTDGALTISKEGSTTGTLTNLDDLDSWTSQQVVDNLQNLILQTLTPVFEDFTEVVVMDHPDHKNRGDSAIYVGEIRFLRRLNKKVLYECAHYAPDKCDTQHVKEILNENSGMVTLHGGGNFGDIWTYMDTKRQGLIKKLAPFYNIFVFPQTVFYYNLTNAKIANELYSEVPSLTFSARDQTSYDILGEHFPTVPRLLCPDMAFMMGMQPRRLAKVDILWLLRKDKETPFGSKKNDKNYFKNAIPKEHRNKVSMTFFDWEDGDISLKGLDTPTKRAEGRVEDALDHLSEGRVVITDRLHAHILCILLDIPHVILDNTYGKIFHFHQQWTSKLENTKMAKTVEEAAQYAIELLATEKAQNTKMAPAADKKSNK